jgi:hypothetical protein
MNFVYYNRFFVCNVMFLVATYVFVNPKKYFSCDYSYIYQANKCYMLSKKYYLYLSVQLHPLILRKKMHIYIYIYIYIERTRTLKTVLIVFPSKSHNYLSFVIMIINILSRAWNPPSTASVKINVQWWWLKLPIMSIILPNDNETILFTLYSKSNCQSILLYRSLWIICILQIMFVQFDLEYIILHKLPCNYSANINMF